MSRRTLGVLGGLGPLATVDFLGKLFKLSGAMNDQDHPPVLVKFCTQTPDRSDYLNEVGPNPVPSLVAAARSLREEGAQAGVLLCNTAHIWIEELRATGLPFIDIAEVALNEAKSNGGPVGVLCSPWTVRGRVYSRHAQDVQLIEPDRETLDTILMPAIREVKGGRLGLGRRRALEALRALERQGCSSVVLACTELPLVLGQQDTDLHLVDANESLARACLSWSNDETRLGGFTSKPPQSRSSAS